MPPSKRIRYCPVPGCGLRTNSFRSQYCARHKRLLYAYGHPEGDALQMHELRVYLSTASKIIKDNLEHPDIVKVLVWIESFIERGEFMLRQDAKSPEQDTRRWLAVLQREEITPQAIFEMILAAYLLRYQRPARFRDIKHFRHVVLNRVLRLARGQQKAAIKYLTREYFGQAMIKPLFNYCTTLAKLHYRDWQDTDLTMLEKAKSYNGFDFLPTTNNLPN